MGEYAKYNGQQIKIGTCESMYYLRYSDRHNVMPESGSLNPATTNNLFWRLPFPDEDNIGPGGYSDYNRGLRLYKVEKDHLDQSIAIDFPADDLQDNPGTLQLRHESGLLVNVPCHHGAKLPDIQGAEVFWNGKTHSIELAFLKNTDDGVLPVIRCRHCDKMWRCSWDEVLPYISDEIMRERLEAYEGNQ